MTTELWGVAYRRRCDGHHKNSLLLRPPAADATGPPTHPTPPRCARFGLRSAPAPGRIRPPFDSVCRRPDFQAAAVTMALGG